MCGITKESNTRSSSWDRPSGKATEKSFKAGRGCVRGGRVCVRDGSVVVAPPCSAARGVSEPGYRQPRYSHPAGSNPVKPPPPSR